MNPDDLRQAWQAGAAETRLEADADRLLAELRRKRRRFTATIFWRDVREIGAALLLIVVWLYQGTTRSLPWTWYLAVPVLAWFAGFLLIDRLRHRQRGPNSGESLVACAERSLAELDHQIWLLRNVGWWALLPLAVAVLPFMGERAWEVRSGGWWAALYLAMGVAVISMVLAGVYWLNRTAVRSCLEPRRQELQALLLSLRDTFPGEASN
jgi:hypothetical protein